jgi:hypothetical protein
MQGWIHLHRQIIENELWFSERFSWAQAWIDLLLLASYRPRRVSIRRIAIELEPGELCYSQLSLADRWKWNRKTVKSFLDELARREMILIKADKRLTRLTTVITIQNWNHYQGDGHLTGQRRDIGTGTNKKIDNLENVEKEEARSLVQTNSYDMTDQRVSEIVGVWNKFAKRVSLSPVSKVTPKRKNGVKARLKEENFDMGELLKAIESQPFLLGHNQRAWRVDFDWIFLHPDNYIKIIEGKYETTKRSETDFKHPPVGSQADRVSFRHTEADIQRFRNFEATIAERDRERRERTDSL